MPTPPSGRAVGSTLRRWRVPAVELAGLIAGVALFSWLHDMAGSDIARASANAHHLQSIERTLHLDIELAANQWLAASALPSAVAVWFYRLYYLPLAAILLWVLFRRSAVYRRVRTVLVVMAALALLTFWLVPMSPPRFAMPGIVDVVAAHDPFGGGSRELSGGQNLMSAFPSLHVAWSAAGAYTAWLLWHGIHPRLAALAWLFPLAMVAVVLGTGNHYVLDVAGSAALLAVSIVVGLTWQRLRPRTGSVPQP